jgi:hypothetical protein
MKRIIVIAALATVTACSQPAPAPEATAEASADVPAAATVQTVAADGQPSTGTFKVTTADGKVFMEEVKPDGTYVQTQDGKVVQTGTWVQKSPSQYCVTKDAEGAKEECNTEQIDAKGVWTSVDPEGKTATIERVTT